MRFVTSRDPGSSSTIKTLIPERSLKSSVCICGLPSDLIIRLGSARRRWLTTKNRPYHELLALLLILLERLQSWQETNPEIRTARVQVRACVVALAEVNG